MPGCPTKLDNSRARATVLALGVGVGCLDILSLLCHFSLLSSCLWEMA